LRLRLVATNSIGLAHPASRDGEDLRKV